MIGGSTRASGDRQRFGAVSAVLTLTPNHPTTTRTTSKGREAAASTAVTAPVAVKIGASDRLILIH